MSKSYVVTSFAGKGSDGDRNNHTQQRRVATATMRAQMGYYGDTGLLIAKVGSKFYLVFDRWTKGAVKTRTCTRCKRKLYINQEQMQQLERLPRHLKWNKCLCYECAKS